MRWVTDCSAEALGDALRSVAPELSGYQLTVPVSAGSDPLWHKSSAVIEEHFVVKFALSRPAALRLARGQTAVFAGPRSAKGTAPRQRGDTVEGRAAQDAAASSLHEWGLSGFRHRGSPARSRPR